MSGRSGRGNQNFNSLPHTEVDTGTYFTKIIPKTFQLTTSHRGRPSEALLYRLYGTYFNSLPHTEVDAHACSQILWFTFQLTTSHRGRRGDFSWEIDYVVFQLTTSHRGRRKHLLHAGYQEYFNSLPHTEVDDFKSRHELKVIISTHYLTQR